MNENQAVAVQLLHDEPLAAKQSHPYFFLEGNSYRNSLGRAEKGVFLADDPAVVFGQFQGNDFSRIRRGKSDLAFTGTSIGEDSGEQPFAGDQPFSRAEHFIEK